VRGLWPCYYLVRLPHVFFHHRWQNPPGLCCHGTTHRNRRNHLPAARSYPSPRDYCTKANTFCCNGSVGRGTVCTCMAVGRANSKPRRERKKKESHHLHLFSAQREQTPLLYASSGWTTSWIGHMEGDARAAETAQERLPRLDARLE
jgi:hypothetical protein